ncbi:TlpA family protein disulfide reductase [Actinomyces israelii]|uniref:TlpA family protein disulfide reductase n=1 Tax=Actinomyces israelii TaxID=1659 RepID=UPI0009FF8078|nr:TlpA disulfide reductase family protein [Actinomyces israelii]
MPDRSDPPEHDDEPGELAESDERADGPDEPAEPDELAESDVRPDELAEPAEPDELAESDVGSAESDESDESDEKRSSADEPAWRARLRRSGFGQIAVVLVTSFAIAIAAWWVVKPSTAEDPQAETAVVTQVEVEGVQKAPVAGDAAPAFEGADIEGHRVSLAQMRGKPVWLVFMATWCTGCRTEMPDVQAAAAAHGDDIQVVVVYVGESLPAVRSYSERVGNDFTQVADQDQTVSASYGIMGVPSHFFVDADGVVQQVHVGPLGPDQMDQSIEAVKAG